MKNLGNRASIDAGRRDKEQMGLNDNGEISENEWMSPNEKKNVGLNIRDRIKQAHFSVNSSSL